IRSPPGTSVSRYLASPISLSLISLVSDLFVSDLFVSDLFVSDVSSLISAPPHLSMFAFPPPGVGRSSRIDVILATCDGDDTEPNTEATMNTPYNIDTQNNCQSCSFRSERQFCNMGTATIQRMDEIKFTAVYPKGSVLFVEGEQPRGVFIICSGRAKLTTSSAEGKTLIVKIAEAGEV